MYKKVGAKIFSSKIHSIYISFPFFRKLNNFCWLFHENETDFKTKRYWWDTRITKVKEALAFFAKNLFLKSETCTLFSTLSSYIILLHTFTWSFDSFFSYIFLFQPFFSNFFLNLFFRLNLKFINSWHFFVKFLPYFLFSFSILAHYYTPYFIILSYRKNCHLFYKIWKPFSECDLQLFILWFIMMDVWEFFFWNTIKYGYYQSSINLVEFRSHSKRLFSIIIVKNKNIIENIIEIKWITLIKKVDNFYNYDEKEKILNR